MGGILDARCWMLVGRSWELAGLGQCVLPPLPTALGVAVGATAGALLVEASVPLLVVRTVLVVVRGCGRGDDVPPSTFPGRWLASSRDFLSRSSLGISSDTTSPALIPSWISAKK